LSDSRILGDEPARPLDFLNPPDGRLRLVAGNVIKDIVEVLFR
jgi:hypothetical protein